MTLASASKWYERISTSGIPLAKPSYETALGRLVTFT
jgi:hypothetical protein